MKVIIITRQEILRVFAVLVIGIFACVVTAQGVSAVQASSQPQKIPIYSVETTEKKVAISFNTAWENRQTEALISILNQFQVNASFFVTGTWIDSYPESAKAIFDAGNELCNYSDTGSYMTRLSKEQILSEIEMCNQKIISVTETPPTLFRAPYGDYDNTVLEFAEKTGMQTVIGNIDSWDWKNLNAQEIYNRVTSLIQPGSILLFQNGAEHTTEVLPLILKFLQDNGYQIVPVSALVYQGEYLIDNAGKQIPEGLTSASLPIESQDAAVLS